MLTCDNCGKEHPFISNGLCPTCLEAKEKLDEARNTTHKQVVFNYGTIINKED